MSQQRLTESREKTKQRIERRESCPASARSFQGGLHPILQLQRTIGNRAVGRLIQAKLAVSHPGDPYEREANRVAEQVTSMPSPASTPTAQRQMMPDEEKDKQPLQTKPLAASMTPLAQRQAMPEEEKKEAPGFDKRDQMAVQIMIRVLSARESSRPDLENLSVELRAEHKEWILQLWSAATGQSGGASRLTMPERHEALAFAMRRALRLADRYALEAPSSGKTMRVELRDALQTLRTDLYAAESKPTAGGPFGFGFVPKIVGMGSEPKQARKGARLSDQPAELREVVYLSFPSRATPKEPAKWFGDLTDRQQSAFTGLYNALRAKDLIRFVHTIHSLDNGEPHFWGVEQEGNTVSLKVVGDSDGLNQRLGDPGSQGEIALDSPFMAIMHKGQKSYRERTSGPGLHISVGPGKFWDVHIDAHPPVRGQEKESDADLTNRFLMHGLQELFPNMPRALLIFLLKKVHIPSDIAKKIGNQALPAIRFFPATDSPLWRSDNPALIKSLEIQALERDGRQMTATVGISTHF